MKKNYIKHFKLGLKSQILGVIAGLFAFSANAQTIDVTAAEPDRPDPTATYYTGTTDQVTFSTTGSFASGTTFYLHTGILEEDNVLDQRTSDGTFDFTWPRATFGAENLFITAATGSFDAQTIDVEQSMISIVGGNIDNAFDVFANDYDLTGVGVRRVTTQPINVDFSDEVVLNISFSDAFVVAERPIRVQFSTDGTNFTNMTDTNSDDEWFATGVRNLQFVLTSGQKTAGTIFRIVQENSNSLTSFEEAWYLDDDISLEVGGIIQEVQTFIATYTIDEPSVTLTAFNDDGGNPAGSYSAGQSIEIEATFVGGTDQVDDFNYTVVFRDGDERFQLESVTDANVGNAITVGGTIPADIEFDETWTVTVEAFTGSEAQIGLQVQYETFNFNLGELTGVGGSLGSVWEFSADEERSLTTPELDIESNSNASVSFTLAKISAGLAPDGTEIVLEYATDGMTFTQIGDAVSLNADLSEDVLFDALPAGVVSSTTQFRIRQLSNNGAGLSTWSVNNLQINAGGTIISNGDITYNGANIFVSDPTITLDPVNVPDDLIYPGSEVDLVYNITAGALATGTTLTAVLDNGVFEYEVGTASAITPGDSEDHTITITIPALVGGNYSVSLISSTEVESNSITVPVYNTTLEITEITSNSGVTDGGQDVIFPGSEITVDYNVDGNIGAGAELMLEVRDWDQDEEDNDGFVIIATETGIDGSITGTLPTDIDFDDDGSENPTIRIKVGNGVLAQASTQFVEDENGNDIFFDGFSETIFDLDQTTGNNPMDEDVFIGAGERASATLPFDFSLGGTVQLSLTIFGGSFNGTPQNVYLQGSIDDGATWTVIDEQEYAGGNIFFNDVIPQALRSETTRLRFVYNMNGEAAEFENQLRMNYITLTNSQTTQANTDTEDISGQFRKPTVSLEVLDSYDFVTGEQFTIEYTTSGPFPANTAFAIVMEGPDGLETVIGESEGQGLTSVDVTMPSFAYDDNGSGAALYNEIKVVAFNKATPTTTYTPDETIIIDEDEQFLVIEGTNDDDGNYFFNLAGDRSLLTQAFDLSGADNVFVNFTFSDIGINPTDNLLTIPVLQVSTDGGATFQNIPAEEDGLLGDGYLFNNNSYSGEVPSEFITAATHFRWYQPLNLGVNQDRWRVQNISITVERGNEITTFYTQENSPENATLDHPDITQFEWEQANADTDPVFNGETFSYTWDKVFESTDNFPANTNFAFVLYDNNEGEFVIDPDTNRPYVVGSTTSLGTFDASIPFFVEEGNYSIRLIASIEDAENGDYFFFGDEDGESTQQVGTLEVFLRAIRTSLVGDENDVVYAGSTVTFSTGIENDDENATNTDDLFANLIVNYSGDDWILATQQGTADITADLPPFINGNRSFRIELSEDGPLGEVGDIIGDSELEELGNDEDSFIAGTIDNVIETSFAEFINSNDNYRVQFDYFAPSTVSFSLQRSINGGEYVTQNNYIGTSGNDIQSSSVFLSFAQNIRYRWVLTSGESLEISDVRIEDIADNQENFFGTSLVPNNFADGSLNFENSTGRGLITTRDFEVGELENASLLSFDVNFGEIPANMVANQFLIFEFSTDGGANYTELQTFPEADADETLNGDNFTFAITDAMKTNPTRFRFRQEERNNIAVSIANFAFVAGQSLPFDYISTNVAILNQAILINSISVSESCIENSFDINYEIRGRFGMENVLEIQYEDRANNNGVFNLDGFEFEGITEGTGTLSGIKLPGDAIDEGGNNGTFYFRINADDDTNEDFNFFVTGTYNEEGVEVVAPINLDASFNLPSQRLCDLMNLEVSINSPQNYFTYELRNAADGTVLGTLTYDPEVGDNVIEIGELTQEIAVELSVTSRSSNGLACNTIVSTYNDELDVLSNFQLYRRNANDNRVLVVAGDGDSNCEGQPNVIRLEVLRNNGGGSFSGISTNNVEWFRDNVNNPIANPGGILGDGNNELIRSGNYFARVTDGDCIYTTESFAVTIIDTPDKPAITVTSGELSGCEGAEDVVLTAPDGFAFYQWNTGETTQSITVEDAGSYTVQVSNENFANSCGSDSSDPVIVEREELPFFEVGTSTTLNNGKIAAGQTIEGCEGLSVYFFSDGSRTVFGGTVTIIRDGVAVATTTNSSYFIEVSGDYSFTWTNNNINFDCETSTVEFTADIIAQPTDVPVLTASGNLEFCDREGEVTLTAPAGFAQYRWYRNGSLQSSNVDGFDATSNTFVVRQDGDYTVEVGNSASCFSPRSNVIEVTVRSLPAIPGFSQFEATCGEGPITFSFGGNDLYSYQLINAFTGLPSGDPVIGNDGTTYITSASVAEDTDFYLEVSYADGSGCSTSVATNEVTGSPNNVVLEADGNRLNAIISRWGGTPQREIRWFRNGVLLRNRTNNNSISVTDAAEYSVEVEFEGEGLCTVTSNSIDLGAGVVPPSGSTGGRIEANSYPNPSQGGVVNVDIKGGNFGKYQINIMTLTGQVLVSVDTEKDAVEYSEQIDISKLERGIYNIQVIKGKEFKNIRFIIQ